MKKILLVIFIATLGVVNTMAQTADSTQYQATEISVDSLVVKLNTLQRDYDYLYCDHELNKVMLELKDFSNSINITSNTLLVSYHNKNFERDLYTSYLELYNSNIRFFSSLKEKVDTVKVAVACKVLTANFTEQELKVISQSFDVIDNSISSVESALKHFKVVIDAYKSLR